MQDSDMFAVMRGGEGLVGEGNADWRRVGTYPNEGMLLRACQADKILWIDGHGDVSFVMNAVEFLD